MCDNEQTVKAEEEFIAQIKKLGKQLTFEQQEILEKDRKRINTIQRPYWRCTI